MPRVILRRVRRDTGQRDITPNTQTCAWVAQSLLACIAAWAGCAAGENPYGQNLCGDEQGLLGGGQVDGYLGLSGAKQRAVVSIQLANAQGELAAPCSGVVVHQRWVLTAKHCLGEGKPVGAVVSFGAQARCADAQLGALRVLMHDELDLMAVELEAPVSELAPEILPLKAALSLPEHIAAGSLVLLAGYGYDTHGRLGTRAFLVEPVTEITSTTLEVDGAGYSGACGGDSGGPLLQRDAHTGEPVVLGVLSTGSTTCLGRDQYVRLDAAKDWLEALGIAGASGPHACDAIDAVGRCFGRLAVYCERDSLRARVCPESEGCTFDPAAQRYGCALGTAGPCGDYDQVGRCENGTARFCESGTLRESACALGEARCARDNVDGVARCLATAHGAPASEP